MPPALLLLVNAHMVILSLEVFRVQDGANQARRLHLHRHHGRPCGWMAWILHGGCLPGCWKDQLPVHITGWQPFALLIFLTLQGCDHSQLVPLRKLRGCGLLRNPLVMLLHSLFNRTVTSDANQITQLRCNCANFSAAPCLSLLSPLCWPAVPWRRTSPLLWMNTSPSLIPTTPFTKWLDWKTKICGLIMIHQNVTYKGDGFKATLLNMTSQQWLTYADVDRSIWWHYVVSSSITFRVHPSNFR